MSFLYRPGKGPAPDLYSTHGRSEIARIEHAVFTKASCDLAWKVFSDWKRWPSFSNIYASPLEWKGTPWSPGSRLQFKISHPIRTKVDRVITFVTPPRCVARINQVHGYTMEQWVLFDPFIGGGTKVTTWIELTGGDLPAELRETKELLNTILANWFANFSFECDRMAESV